MTEGKSLEEIAQLSAKTMWAEDQASQALGLEILEVAPGRAILALSIGQTMINGHGTCHGGYIFILADSAFAFACNSHGSRNVAQHCSIAYLAPARLGMRLIAVAEERQRAERSGITDVTVRDETGQIIAEFRGHSRTVPGSLLPAA